MGLKKEKCIAVIKRLSTEGGVEAVSYTHLDVYKRQVHAAAQPKNIFSEDIRKLVQW